MSTLFKSALRVISSVPLNRMPQRHNNVSLRLSKIVWQQMITSLTSENRRLRKRVNCLMSKTVAVNKSVCMKQAAGKPKRKSTDCTNCFEHKSGLMVNSARSQRNRRAELLNCVVMSCEKAKSPSSLIQKAVHNNLIYLFGNSDTYRRQSN